MVVYSWIEKWKIPTDERAKDFTSISFNIAMLLSITRKYHNGEDISHMETLLVNRQYPNTPQGWLNDHNLSGEEICLILMSMQSDKWYIYRTSSNNVPYILSNEKGDYISPMVDANNDILFSVPVTKMINGSFLKPLFRELGADISVDTPDKLLSLYPHEYDILEDAFQPGYPFASYLLKNQIGNLIPNVSMIKALKGTNIVFSS